MNVIMLKAYKLQSLLLISFLVFASYSCKEDNHVKMFSPLGDVELEINQLNGVIGFSQIYKNDTVISFSPIGLTVNQTDLSVNSIVKNITKITEDNTWKTVNGKFREIRNNYNEYKINCEVQERFNYQLVIRCYDDGFAYRYLFPVQNGLDSISIQGESTCLNFQDNFTYWAFNDENHNIGPVNRQEHNQEIVNTPLVIHAGNNHYVAMHAAGIVRYAPFSLNASGKVTSMSFNVEHTKDQLPVTTSWRAFITGKKPGDLPESKMIMMYGRDTFT